VLGLFSTVGFTGELVAEAARPGSRVLTTMTVTQGDLGSMHRAHALPNIY
jgi:hypothetical protein